VGELPRQETQWERSPMNRQDVEKWVSRQGRVLGAYLSRGLGELVGVLIQQRRLGVTLLALGLAATTRLKHRIKRVDRFLGNRRLDLETMFRLLGSYWWRSRERVLLGLDWTELPGGFPALVLSVIVRGRSVPIAWEVVASWRFHRSRNALEEGLLLLVESYWPASVERVVIADRGFGRAALARFLSDHGWGYILRVDPKVHVRDRRGHAGLYNQYPVDGRVRYRRQVWYRYRNKGVTTELVWTHQTRQREPWYLVTNLLDRVSSRQVVNWYGRRMRIEEMFRDGKNERWGFGLKETRLRQPGRWARLLLIWAWAMLILLLIGDYARHHHLADGLCSSSRQRLKGHAVLSDLTIGLRLFAELPVSIPKLLRHLRTNQNWG